MTPLVVTAIELAFPASPPGPGLRRVVTLPLVSMLRIHPASETRILLLESVHSARMP